MTDLLTYQQAADILGVSDKTVRRISKRELPRVEIGHKTVRIKRIDLAEYLRRKTVSR